MCFGFIREKVSSIEIARRMCNNGSFISIAFFNYKNVERISACFKENLEAEEILINEKFK